MAEWYTKTAEGEQSILIRLAQKYAAGLNLSGATTEELVAAIKAGMAERHRR